MQYRRKIKAIGLVLIMTWSLNVKSQNYPVQILFIGNSFMNAHNMTSIESNLARAAGIDAYISSYLVYGKSVDDFIHDAACWEKIRSSSWDFIVIQDNQRYYYGPPGALDSFGRKIPLLKNNLKFQDSIKKRIPCVKIIYFAGWEQEGGVPERFKDDNTAKMIDRILANYRFLNTRKGVNNVIAPVGVAWKSVISQRPFMVKKPYSNYYLYDSDGRHPGLSGTYLSAYVLFITLFRQSPVNLSNRSVLAGSELDTFLKKTAWQAVMDSFSYSNLSTQCPAIKSDSGALYTRQGYASYQWYADGVAQPGATGYMYRPVSETSACRVEVKDMKGCVFRSFPYQRKP